MILELAALDERISSYNRRFRNLFRTKIDWGKSGLFGISKRGDRYLRTLLILGTGAILGKAGGKQDAKSVWINRMRERRHPKVVAVALNKNARIVWSILSKNEDDRGPETPNAS